MYTCPQAQTLRSSLSVLRVVRASSRGGKSVTLNREEPIAPFSDRAGALESSRLLFARTGVTAMDTRMVVDYLLVIMALGLVAYLTVAPLIFPD